MDTLSDKQKNALSKYIKEHGGKIESLLAIPAISVTQEDIVDVFNFVKDKKIEFKDLSDTIIGQMENSPIESTEYLIAQSIINKAVSLYGNNEWHLENWEEEEDDAETLAWYKEEIAIQKNTIRDLGIDTTAHLDKVIDAILTNSRLVQKVFGDSTYNDIKDKITLSKNLYTELSDQEIKKTPTFVKYLAAAVDVKTKKQTKPLTQKKESIFVPSKDLQFMKDTINTIDNLLKTINSDYVMDIGDIDKKEQIKNFLKTYIKWKKDSVYESYSIWDVKNQLTKQRKTYEKKHASEKKKYLEKKKKQVTSTTEKKLTTILPNKDLIDAKFLNKILKRFKSEVLPKTNTDSYGEKDLREMDNISNWFTSELSNNTDKKRNSDELTIVTDLEPNQISFDNDNISAHSHTSKEMKKNEEKLNDFFASWNFGVRETILNRIIEYIVMHLIEYRLNKWSTIKFNIGKSDTVDDVFAGTDYIISYSRDKKNYVWFIDLVISNTEETIKKKHSSAQKDRILYNYRINQGEQSKTNTLWLPKVKRSVVDYDPIATYSIIKEAMCNLEATGKIYGEHKDLTERLDKWLLTTGDLYQQIKQNYEKNDIDNNINNKKRKSTIMADKAILQLLWKDILAPIEKEAMSLV